MKHITKIEANCVYLSHCPIAHQKDSHFRSKDLTLFANGKQMSIIKMLKFDTEENVKCNKLATFTASKSNVFSIFYPFKTFYHSFEHQISSIRVHSLVENQIQSNVYHATEHIIMGMEPLRITQAKYIKCILPHFKS